MVLYWCSPDNPSVPLLYVSLSVFSFPDNLSKDQWIFTKLGVIIDIVEIWFWIANGQISSFLTELSASNTSIFSFQDINLSKSQWIFTRLYMCIDSVEIWFEIAYGQISSIFNRVICLWHNNGWVLLLHVLFGILFAFLPFWKEVYSKRKEFVCPFVHPLIFALSVHGWMWNSLVLLPNDPCDHHLKKCLF